MRKNYNGTTKINPQEYTIPPDKVQTVVIGRSLCLDPAVLERTIDLVKKYQYASSTCLPALESRLGYLRTGTGGIPKGLMQKPYVIPIAKSESGVLRKGERLFENECSIFLGQAGIFLPGVFPFKEIFIYSHLGEMLKQRLVEF